MIEIRNRIIFYFYTGTVLCFVALTPVASGRVDRMFQVLPDQENDIRMEDLLSDGLLVVELESSPTGTPQPQPKTGSLLSPAEDTV